MKTSLFIFALLSVLIASACSGGSSSPTAPTTPTPVVPTRATLMGSVTVTGTTVGLNGITITILDGGNVGRTATTVNGTYSLPDLTAGNANVSATAAGWQEARAGVVINGTTTLNFTTRTIQPWVRGAAGNTVFDKPLWVTRVRIQGSYGGNSSNFIIWCGSSLLVNELLGTSWGRTQYDGTHSAPSCTEVRIENSTGVSWNLTEVR